jgi:hypothetical protein
LEVEPFNTLKTTVEYNNFAVAEYVYKRLGSLSDERHYDLVNEAIDSDAPDCLEMLLEGYNKITQNILDKVAKEGSDDIIDVIRGFHELDVKRE